MLAIPSRLAIPAFAITQALPPLPLYVNSVTGSDGNSGTESSPLKTLTMAQTLCAGLPEWVIRVSAPESQPIIGQLIYESSHELTIEGKSGEAWHARGGEQLTGWSGGPVYTKALTWTTVGTIVVRTMKITIGGVEYPVELTQNMSTPTTPAAGEWGYTGGTLYVRLPESANPAAHTIEGARFGSCLLTRGLGWLVVKNVNAQCAVGACLHNGLSGQPVGSGLLRVESSHTMFGEDGIGASGYSTETVCTNCTSQRNRNDGFNLHAANVKGENPKMVLNACTGEANGDKEGESSQGASNHEETHMIINGGSFNYNVSGGMVTVQKARCDIHGDTAFGAVTMNGNMRFGNTAGTIAAQAGCAWMETTTGEVTGSVSVTNGQGSGVKLVTHGNVSGINGIVTEGNALPNEIA
jgi:hypothetical protein